MFYPNNVVSGLEDPNMAQAGLASADVVTGAGAAWFGPYVNSKSDAVIKVQNRLEVYLQLNSFQRKKKNPMMPHDEAEG